MSRVCRDLGGSGKHHFRKLKQMPRQYDLACNPVVSQVLFATSLPLIVSQVLMLPFVIKNVLHTAVTM